jgi:hypothetical protein
MWEFSIGEAIVVASLWISFGVCSFPITSHWNKEAGQKMFNLGFIFFILTMLFYWS